jgi:hypothetical protein
VTNHALIGIANADAAAVADEFAAGLQAGHDRRAEILNQQFAADIVWGSPYGALVEAYDELHAIHTRFQQRATTDVRFRYRVHHVLAVTEGVIIAHIAREGFLPDGKPGRHHLGMMGDIKSERWATSSWNRWATSNWNGGRFASESAHARCFSTWRASSSDIGSVFWSNGRAA